jgi:hypothetical protein
MMRNEKALTEARIRDPFPGGRMAFPLNLLTERQSRSCGSCSACCELLAVSEVDKPVHTRCQHQLEASLCHSGGCAIYAHRPQSCQDYQCLYQSGILDGDERRRPDRLGLLFNLIDTPAGTIISGWEVWEGAADTPACRYLLDKLSVKTLVLVRRYRSERYLIYGPEHKVADIRRSVADLTRGLLQNHPEG